MSKSCDRESRFPRRFSLQEDTHIEELENPFENWTIQQLQFMVLQDVAANGRKWSISLRESSSKEIESILIIDRLTWDFESLIARAPMDFGQLARRYVPYFQPLLAQFTPRLSAVSSALRYSREKIQDALGHQIH